MMIFVTSSLLSIACQENEGSACVSIGESGGDILIDILCSETAGQPIYNWDSEKPVDSLIVSRVLDEKIVWEIIKIGTMPTITSPVTHGELLSAQPINEDELELRVNVEYKIELSVVDFDANSTATETGSLKFTPLGK